MNMYMHGGFLFYEFLTELAELTNVAKYLTYDIELIPLFLSLLSIVISWFEYNLSIIKPN